MAEFRKPKYIETPEKLWDMWVAYKLHTKANPRYRYVMAQKTGEMVKEPLEVPLTIEGFKSYCHAKFDVTVKHYLDNPDNAYDEYRNICSRIENERRLDQIEGGMVGQYNPSITQRLNGLKEQTENTNTNHNINLINLDPLDDSNDDKPKKNSKSKETD